MDHYLSFLKGNPSKEGPANPSYKLWPTYLHAAISNGPEWYKKCIDSSNYLMTATMYSNPEYKDYADWLMGESFSDKEELLCQMSMFSPSVDFIGRYQEMCQQYSGEMLYAAVESDNLPVFANIYGVKNMDAQETISALKRCCQMKANKCLHFLTKRILKYQPDSLGTNTWAHLAFFNDLSVVEDLKPFLELTEPMDNNGFYYKSLKEVMTGTVDQVECVLQDQEKHYIPLGWLANRSVKDENFADLLYKKLIDYNSLKEGKFLTDLASMILSSNRDSAQTEKIIRSLNKRNILFDKELALDFSQISVPSWNAIMATKELFNFEKVFVTDKNYLEHDDILLPEQRDLLGDILDEICSVATTKTITDVFMILGSSIAFWGTLANLFFNIHDPKRNIMRAAQCGNVTLLAIGCQDLLNSGDPISATYFCSLPVHKECVPFLRHWFNSTPEQQDRFFREDFGPHFWDTSVVSNRNGNISKDGDALTIFRSWWSE